MGVMGMVRWGALVTVGVLWVQPVWATVEISPSFLGMYRKTMEIDNELFTYAARYGVDPRTARAVVIQESGGNANLVSSAGARGYFQVMPSTFRMLGVRSNIEAGIKYLSQLQRRFSREDYAIAAYNAGPGTIAKDRPLRLETLQYVIGVGHYKSVLRLYEPEIRSQAEALRLYKVRRGDSWETMARTTGVPTLLLRLYNPFLATRPLQAESLIAYPVSAPLQDLLEYEGDTVYYTSRVGDSYLNLAFVLGVELENFRRDNDLWRLQQLPVGVRLRATLPSSSPFYPPQLVSKPSVQHAAATGQLQAVQVVEAVQAQSSAKPAVEKGPQAYTVRRGDSLERIARRYETTVSALMWANGLQSSRIRAGASLVIPAGKGAGSQVVAQQPRVHKIRRGETLGRIARRYKTTVSALMRANGLRSSRIQAGALLHIPG